VVGTPPCRNSAALNTRVLIEDWRRAYNEHHPHSALGMTAPAWFARAWRENPENARPITPAARAERLSTPHTTPIPNGTNENEPDPAPEADQTALATTLQPTTHQRLSQQVDR